MTAFAEVQFKGTRRGYFTAPGMELRPGQWVVVEADRGEDVGEVTAVGLIAERKCSSSIGRAEKIRGPLRVGDGVREVRGHDDHPSPVCSLTGPVSSLVTLWTWGRRRPASTTDSGPRPKSEGSR